MSDNKSTPVEERVGRQRSAAPGDTGDGNTGAASDGRGISNRQDDGDLVATSTTDDDEAINIVNESDDVGDDEDEDDSEDEDEHEDEEDEVDDPHAEPGKPI